ncbi:peptidase domain-containing ABC transporter [uncultured Desulfovibrio sp.]|uniref:peptidase domain-containing ABC transporter n=1 Tax=uncultured Desulfovibrio sp. TaxID=167968 RepID=UPI002670907A|nr:peptidase domain-containing ABC transporter [uncultured Desulfovibrio sp.]
MQFPTSIVPCLALAAHLCKLPAPASISVPQKGTVPEADLEALAQRLGIGINVVHGEPLADIAARPLAGPVALPLKNGASVLFVGKVRGKPLASVIDPAQKPLKQVNIPFADLEPQWTGVALLLTPQRQPHRHVQALVSIARHYNKDLAADDLIHSYLLQNGEPDPKLFLRMLGDNGFQGHTAALGLDGLVQMQSALPAVLHCQGGGLLILWQINEDGSLEIENPDRPFAGHVSLPRAEVEPLLTGQVTFVKSLHVESAIPPPPKKFGFSFFLNEIKQMKANMAEVGLAAIALQVLGLAMPLFFQIIIDRVVTHHAEITLHVLALGMLAAIIFEAVFGWLRSYLLLYATSVIDLRLAIRTFEHLTSVALPFFERTPAGVLIKHMQQPEKIREFLTGRLFGAMLDSVSLFVVLPILFAYSWRLTVLVLLFSGLSALIIFLAMGPFRQRLQDLYATEGERQAFLVENIRAMPTVKSLSLEPLRRRGWDNRAAVATGMRFRVGKMSIAISTFMQVMQKCMTLVIIWWGVYQVFDNTMTVGALVAFNMYSARVTGPLVQIAGLIQQYQETGISMRMLAQVMDEPPEDGGARGVLPRINGAIRCRNLTFRYTKDGAPALSDVSFDCPAGSVLGVVGRSGSGKSTLTRLIQRLQPLQEGDIWIDNHNIRDIDMAHLRRSIGVVLQENFLFRGRVRDNIAMTRPTATLEEIVHAARMAAAHEFIEKLPEGYNTVLEEGGSNLSGGQRQRLAIARALLTDPKLMIFDEATSALDPESEAEIQGNINTIGRGRTMIIVSHRLSMLRHADQILVLDGGRLVGAGAHEDVYANCPIYRSLWDRQNAVQQGAL